MENMPIVNKEKILKKGNGSIAVGAAIGISSVIQPCPLCVVAAAAFIANGIREKIW